MSDKVSKNTRKSLASVKVQKANPANKQEKGKKAEAQNPLRAAELKAERKKKLTAIVIAIFAVLMALSMMLPSLTSIFYRQEASQTAKQEQEKSSGEQSNSQTSQKTGVEAVDEKYQKLADEYDQKLSADPKNLAALLNKANNLAAWAGEASMYASDDAAKSHVNDLYGKAIAAYEDYLKLNDSDAVRINIANCYVGQEDTTKATDLLNELLAKKPDYAPAYLSLGIIAERSGDTQKALDLYEKAADLDKNNEYGAKQSADSRIASIQANKAAQSGQTGAQALENSLGASSGTNQ